MDHVCIDTDKYEFVEDDIMSIARNFDDFKEEIECKWCINRVKASCII